MIEIKNLSYKYHNSKTKALDNLNLKVEEGKWISILGHNGSGKSTLAKILVGLFLDYTGEVHIDGLELTEDNVNEIHKKIGIVFQNPDNQFVGITVKNDIAFGLENRCMSRAEMIEKVEEALKQIDMVKYKDKEPHNLSGGQKQKVAVGGVIACDLKYIIFDEATSMLDPKGSHDIINLISDLKENHNRTVITITHDLDLAKKSDYIYVLKSGKIILEGSPDVVFLKQDILASSNIVSPISVDIYHQVANDDKLKKDEELVELLWQLSLTM